MNAFDVRSIMFVKSREFWRSIFLKSIVSLASPAICHHLIVKTENQYWTSGCRSISLYIISKFIFQHCYSPFSAHKLSKIIQLIVMKSNFVKLNEIIIIKLVFSFEIQILGSDRREDLVKLKGFSSSFFLQK